MADTLYLSLWYPNLQLATLPDKLTAVLSEFAAHGGEARVYAATVWPVNWSEPPVFQRVWGRGQHASEGGVEPRLAVQDALELLHDDYAYEFQIAGIFGCWKPKTQHSFPPLKPANPPRSAPLQLTITPDAGSASRGLCG